MKFAPNLVEGYSRRSNKARNILFLVFCIALIAWYGLVATGHSEEVSDKILTVLTPEKKDKQGGDVTIELVEKKIMVPVKTTTSTVDLGGFSARAILVKDHETGETLLGKDEYTVRPIASITKLLSGLVLLDNAISFTSTTVAINGGVADGFLLVDTPYTIEDVWNVAFVGSSNRAVLTLVEASGLSKETFVERMNQKARELGMSDARFTDPTGLDETDMASASDVLLLLNAALDRKEIYDALALKQYEYAPLVKAKTKGIYSTNWLLMGWIPHTFEMLFPGKTGYIPESGYNFTTRVQNKEGRALDIVILGAESHEARFEEARDIAQWIFENYTWQEKIIIIPKK